MCIRGVGVRCPYRMINTLEQCRALCDKYKDQCFTFVHNRYGECYLRTDSGTYEGVPDAKAHSTISCRRDAKQH